MLLVLSNSRDETTDYLLSRLTGAGIPHLRLDSDTLHENVTVSHDRGGSILHFGHRGFRPHEFTAVWLRRPEKLNVEVGDEVGDRDYARKEWAAALEGFLTQIPPRQWINWPSANAHASQKIEQLARARSFGLLVPDSIVTQDPILAREFFGTHTKNGVITKPLSIGYVSRPMGGDTLIYTSKVSEADLCDESSLSVCPTLFQEMIRKTTDVRITILDHHMIAIAIERRDLGGSIVLDVRSENMAGAKYTPIEVPEATRTRLFSFIESYGLRFAAVDFVIDHHNEWVFLEVNPNGQWAWLDLVGGAQIWKAFVDVMRRPSGPVVTPLSAIDSATWLALRVCRLPVTRDHVRAKSVDDQVYVPQIRADEVKNSQDVLDYAVSTFERANDRKKSIDEKAKFLGGVITLAITVSVALSARVHYSAAIVFPGILFVISLLLLIAYFRLSTAAQPQLTPADVKKTDEEIVCQLISDYLSSADFNERRTSFSAEVFRAAVTFFLAGAMVAILSAFAAALAP